ncbi:unnamed protein product, partial [Allacma fusca]
MKTYEELSRDHHIIINPGQCLVEKTRLSVFAYHPVLRDLCKTADNTTISTLQQYPNSTTQTKTKAIYNAMKYKQKAVFIVIPSPITQLDYMRLSIREALNDCHQSKGIFPHIFPKGWEFRNPKADTLMKVLSTLLSAGIYNERALLLTFQVATVTKRLQYLQPDD